MRQETVIRRSTTSIY